MAPHHANVYTLKESIGENSNNFCKFLNGTLESTFHGNIMKHLLFQTATLGNQVTKRPELGLEIKIFLCAQLCAQLWPNMVFGRAKYSQVGYP